MLTVTITNTTSGYIGPGRDATTGEEYVHLPTPFAWATIAASGSKAFVCSVADYEKVDPQYTSGFTVAQILQQMMQKGQITVSVADVAADRDLYGKAVAEEVG